MQISLVAADGTDMDLALAWRSNPDIYKGMYQQEGPLEWAPHWRWWKSRQNWWQLLIQVTELVDGEVTTRYVGTVSVGQLDHWKPEIGIYIGEVTLHGQGVGKQALRLIMDLLRDDGCERVSSTIKKDNIASLKCFKAVGFKEVCDAREGEVYLECDLKRGNEEDSKASVAEAPHNI